MRRRSEIILIADGKSDIENIQSELDKINISIQLDVIQEESRLINRLKNNLPDLIIISAHKQSSLTHSKAFHTFRKNHPYLPFIFISDSFNQEKAMEAIHEGASDYISKQHLNRLGPAVLREVTRNRGNRKQRTQFEETRNRYESLIQSVNGIVWEADADTFTFSYVSPQSEELLGFTPEEWLSKPNFWQEHIHPEDRHQVISFCHEKTKRGVNHSFEYRMLDANNEIVWLRDYVTVITKNGRPDQLRGLMVDISRQKRAERQRDKAYKIADIGNWELDLINDNLFWSDTIKRLHEVEEDYTPDLEKAIAFYKKGEHRQRITEAVEQAIEKGTPFDVELKIVTAKNNERWIRTIGEPEFRNGKCIRIFGSTQNITTRKQIELKFRAVVEHSTNMFYQHDTDHVLSYVSPQAQEFLGYPPEEAKQRWTEFITDHPINEEGLKHTQRAIETAEAQPPYPLQLQKRNGEKIWVRVNEAPLVENGETTAIVGSLQDITERKQYEEKLEELALVASKTTDVIFMTDPEERITWVNNAFEEILGYQYDEVIGKSPGNILRGPDNNPQKMKRISEAFKKRIPLQEIVLNYSKSNNKYWFDLTLDPIFDKNGQCEGFIGIQKDVTDQIKRQRELHNSVERYEIVSKATSDTIWDLDLESDTITYNQNIYGMFGYNETEVKNIADWWRNKLHPDDRDNIMHQLNEAIHNNTDRLQLEYRFEAADGTYKYIYDRAFVVTDDSGSAIRVIGAMQDITQQREERKWLQLFESAIASTKESVAIIEGQPSNPPGRKILYVNDAFSQMTGYSTENAKGQTLHMLNGPKTSEKERQKLGQHMNNWKPCDAEFINYKKSGEEFWIRVSMTPVQGPENSLYWICVGRDITERKKDEKQLRTSLKEKETLLLEIHHRVKNNLAVVAGMMQLQAFDEENKQFREKLFDSVARIQTMGSIHELLYQSESFSNLNFGNNLKKLVQNISATFQTDLELEVNFEVDDITLNINQAIPSSLIVNEVITNILKHAFEDDTKEGKITVSAREDNEAIILSIIDNGKGIPPDFDKVMNNKTLGLQLINTLAQQLDADYSYNSIHGGAKFLLLFQKADLKGIGSTHML